MKKLAFAAMMLGAFGLAACGGGDDDGDNVSFVDGGNGDGGGPIAACNPVTQMGCEPGEKCTQVVVQDEPFLARTDCVPDGSVAIGGTCTEAAAGVNEGADDCVAGAYCIAEQCKSICSVTPDSCGDGFACSSYVDTFEDITSTDVGVCDTVCNPVTQDCPIETEGCYLSLANLEGEATCSRVPAMAADKEQGDTCYGPDTTACYLNGCAEGYGSFLFQGEGMARACTKFCQPVNTYRVDPDGSGDGDPNAGADAVGGDLGDCSHAIAPEHQCRFFQNFFIDASGAPLDYVPADYGFCVPADETYGDCTNSAIEEIFAVFDEAEATAEGTGQDAVGMFCEDNGLKCASGCTDLETEDGLITAYCDGPGAAGAACASGAKGKKVMEVVERIRAEQAREAGILNPLMN